MNYSEAVNTGKVVISKIWVNPNSTKDQVSVLVRQIIDNPNWDKSLINNPLAALSQGYNGKMTLDAIQSFKREVAIQYFGTVSANYTNKSSDDGVAGENIGVFLDEKLDIDTAVSVIDSFEPNPNFTKHDPVQNRDGKIMTKDGKKYYRTKFVVPADMVEVTVFKADKVEDNSTAARNVLATATIEQS